MWIALFSLLLIFLGTGVYLIGLGFFGVVFKARIFRYPFLAMIFGVVFVLVAAHFIKLLLEN